jgi:hypothetical protein
MTMTIDYPDTKPTAEKIAKLPKWAQEHIADLERRQRNAETHYREYVDSQTPSHIFYEEYVNVGEKSEHFTRFVQTDRITVKHDGVRLDILLRPEDKGIELQWDDENRRCREIAMVPTSFQKIKLIRKEDIRQ